MVGMEAFFIKTVSFVATSPSIITFSLPVDRVEVCLPMRCRGLSIRTLAVRLRFVCALESMAGASAPPPISGAKSGWVGDDEGGAGASAFKCKLSSIEVLGCVKGVVLVVDVVLVAPLSMLTCFSPRMLLWQQDVMVLVVVWLLPSSSNLEDRLVVVVVAVAAAVAFALALMAVVDGEFTKCTSTLCRRFDDDVPSPFNLLSDFFKALFLLYLLVSFSFYNNLNDGKK